MTKIETSNSRRGWIIVFLLCFGVFSPSYAQYQFTALGSRFMESVSITTSQFSSIVTAPQAPGIFFSLIAGLLVDRYGAKRVLTISFTATALGAFFRIWAGDYISMYICMFLLGVNATFLNANGAKIFGYWFPPKKVSSIMGIFIAVVNGSLAVGVGTGALYPSLKTAFIVSASLAVAAAILWIIFAKDKITIVSDQQGKTLKSETPPVLECLKVVLKSRSVWITGFAIAMLFAGSAAMSLFLPTALVKVRGLDETTAGTVSMALMLGAMISCFITPYIDSKLKKTRLLMLVYGLLGAAGVTFAWRAPQGIPIFILLFLTGFVTTGLSPLLMSIPIQLKEIGTKYAGTAGGVVGTVQLIGSVVIPTYILTPIAGDNYSLLFYLFGGLLVIFAGLSQFLPRLGETY